ncbi:MAG TPA: PIG-L family deacetylase [Actinomycetales bacterium]|nr:PIG-L family deacetylase [Actinomycetales bacterium]
MTTPGPSAVPTPSPTDPSAADTPPAARPPAPEHTQKPAPQAPQGAHALVIVAHPDDADFGAAGTLATWADEGFDTTLLVVTRGDQGGLEDEDMTAQTQRREAEQRAASAVVGVRDVRFLDGFRDGWLEPTFELQKEIVRVIREVRPARVLTQSPERNWDRLFSSHPDHMAVGEATVRACYPAAENPHAWPELVSELGLAAFKVPEIWIMGHPEPNHAVDITDTFERKVEALHQHVSQVGFLPAGALETRLRTWAEASARAAGLPQGRLAEVFKRVWVNAAPPGN